MKYLKYMGWVIVVILLAINLSNFHGLNNLTMQDNYKLRHLVYGNGNIRLADFKSIQVAYEAIYEQHPNINKEDMVLSIKSKTPLIIELKFEGLPSAELTVIVGDDGQVFIESTE